MKAVTWFKNLNIFKKALTVVVAGFLAICVFGTMAAIANPSETPPAQAQAQAQVEPPKEETKAPEEAEPSPETEEEAQPVDLMADPVAATGVEGATAEWMNGDPEGRLLKITFPISDSFTSGMIRTGAQMDTMDILHAVRDSDIDYKRVFIHGTFPMMDQYGNTTEGTPLAVQYLPETVNAVNYDEILVQEKIWDLADMAKVHPDLTN